MKPETKSSKIRQRHSQQYKTESLALEVAQFVRTVFSIFKVEALPDVRLPVQPSAASRKMPRLVFFSLIVNGDGICCTSPDIA